MNKKIVSNYFYSVLYQLLLVIIPLIITPYTTRTLGLTALSVNTATANIVQWVALFGVMGISIYGNREIARVRDDKEELSKTFFEIVVMQIISLVIMMLFLVFYIIVIGDEYASILIIQGFSLVAVALDITWFFYGVEDFKKVSIRNCLVKIIGVIFIFTFVKNPEDLPLFVVINVSMNIIGQGIMWFQVKNYVQPEKIKFTGVARHFIPNIKYFIPQLAISVYSIMDVTMLRSLGPVFEEVYLYEQTQRFIKMFLFFVTSIGTVMLPRLSNVLIKGDVKQLHQYVNKTFRISLYLSIPMIFGICAVINDFVSWFLPLEFQVVGTLIQSGSLLILFISLSNVFGVQYLIPIGNTKHYTYSVTFGAAVNFILNFILIPKFGVYGALFASVIGEMMVTLFQWIIVRKEITITMQLKELFILLLSSTVMGVVVLGIGALTEASLVITLIQGLLGALCYLLLLIVFRAPLLDELNLLKKLHRK
ncbi:MAG: polysaccharide biosynthesis C-terminal domain-containing protein [Anaerorhabdus sp.]